MREDQIVAWLLFVGIVLVFLAGMAIMYIAKKLEIDELKREKAKLVYQLKVRNSELLEMQITFDSYCDECSGNVHNEQAIEVVDDVGFVVGEEVWDEDYEL